MSRYSQEKANSKKKSQPAKVVKEVAVMTEREQFMYLLKEAKAVQTATKLPLVKIFLNVRTADERALKVMTDKGMVNPVRIKETMTSAQRISGSCHYETVYEFTQKAIDYVEYLRTNK